MVEDRSNGKPSPRAYIPYECNSLRPESWIPFAGLFPLIGDCREGLRVNLLWPMFIYSSIPASCLLRFDGRAFVSVW